MEFSTWAILLSCCWGWNNRVVAQYWGDSMFSSDDSTTGGKVSNVEGNPAAECSEAISESVINSVVNNVVQSHVPTVIRAFEDRLIHATQKIQESCEESANKLRSDLGLLMPDRTSGSRTDKINELLTDIISMIRTLEDNMTNKPAPCGSDSVSSQITSLDAKLNQVLRSQNSVEQNLPQNIEQIVSKKIDDGNDVASLQIASLEGQLTTVLTSQIQRVEQNLPQKIEDRIANKTSDAQSAIISTVTSCCKESQEQTLRVLASVETNLEGIQGAERRITAEVKTVVDAVQSSSGSQLDTATIVAQVDRILDQCIRNNPLIPTTITPTSPPEPATRKPVTPKPATPKPATPKPATPKPATPEPKCKQPFITLGQGCYHFSGEQRPWMNWDQGNAYCRGLGSHLVTIDNAQEGAVIKQYLVSSKVQKRNMIGASDLGQRGVWVWQSTSRRIGWSDWAPGEPNNAGGNEHCVDMEVSTGFRWNDVQCNYWFPVICEIDL